MGRAIDSELRDPGRAGGVAADKVGPESVMLASARLNVFMDVNERGARGFGITPVESPESNGMAEARSTRSSATILWNTGVSAIPSRIHSARHELVGQLLPYWTCSAIQPRA
jgi:hypothetical protein